MKRRYAGFVRCWHGDCFVCRLFPVTFASSLGFRSAGRIRNVHCRRGTAGCKHRSPLDVQVVVHAGADRAPARHPVRRLDPRLRRRAQGSQRRLSQTHLDDRGSDRVLRRRARHRRRRRPQEGRAGGRQGAGLFRGDDDGRAHPRHRARLRRRAGPWHEHRYLDPRCQCTQHLCGQRPQAQGRRGVELPPQHHPDHLVRRAGAQRRAAGAVLRDPVRRLAGARRRREGRDGDRDHRSGLHRAVQGDGPDRPRRPARRARRSRLHGRPLRRRIAQATRLSRRAVLCRDRDLRRSWCSAA